MKNILLSTGIIPLNTSRKRIEEMLRESAGVRGYEIDPQTIEVNVPRKGMKVAICQATKGSADG